MGLKGNVRRGFTLVELLVVISIIALLLSILIPTLGKARESGKRVVCAGNLKQIGISIFMYAESNRGFTPTLSAIAPEEYGSIIWHYNREAVGLGLLVKGKYLTDAKLLYCPSVKYGSKGENTKGGDAPWFREYQKAWGDPTKILYGSYDLRREMKLAMVGNPQGSPDWWGPKKRPAGLCMDNMTWLYANPTWTAHPAGVNLIWTDMHLKFNKLLRPYPYGREPYKIRKFMIDPAYTAASADRTYYWQRIDKELE